MLHDSVVPLNSNTNFRIFAAAANSIFKYRFLHTFFYQFVLADFHSLLIVKINADNLPFLL